MGKCGILSRPITEDASIKILTWNDKGGKSTFWHSSAHLMAEALEVLCILVLSLGLVPQSKMDFIMMLILGDRPFGDDDLAAIESKMKELAKKDSVYSAQ